MGIYRINGFASLEIGMLNYLMFLINVDDVHIKRDNCILDFISAVKSIDNSIKFFTKRKLDEICSDISCKNEKLKYLIKIQEKTGDDCKIYNAIASAEKIGTYERLIVLDLLDDNSTLTRKQMQTLKDFSKMRELLNKCEDGSFDWYNLLYMTNITIKVIYNLYFNELGENKENDEWCLSDKVSEIVSFGNIRLNKFKYKPEGEMQVYEFIETIRRTNVRQNVI